MFTDAECPSPRHVYHGKIYAALHEGGREGKPLQVFTIAQRDEYLARFAARGWSTRVVEAWNPPAR